MICDSNGNVGKSSPRLIVVEQKLIDKQVAYLILNGVKKSWIKLCEAADQQMKAIMQYQSDKNNGIQPIYHPEADDGQGSIRANDENKNLDAKNYSKYNLRQRELLLISKHQFYGLRPNEEKKQNVTSTNLKTKNQIKKEESKAKSSHKKQDQNYQIRSKKEAKSKLQVSKSKIEESGMLKKNKKRKKDPQVIEVQVHHPKRKIIKKQDAIKDEKPKTIQIYDGSDSELQMM